MLVKCCLLTDALSIAKDDRSQLKAGALFEEYVSYDNGVTSEVLRVNYG
jgi:hypothetical protein